MHEDARAGMTAECANVVSGGQAEALVRLGHQITAENVHGWGRRYGFGNAVHQQIRNKTSERGAGPMVIRSAVEMAASVGGSGCASLGTS